MARCRKQHVDRTRLLSAEALESRRLLAGVTLITHGFGGNVGGWVSTMADAIEARTSYVDQPRYIVEVTDPGENGGPLTVSGERQSGPPVGSLAHPELIVLLDWSDVAGSFFTSAVRSTVDVGAAVAEALADPDLLADLGTPLTELPLHLIGHSRGGSLVGEIARNLGELGVWVEQITTLDPHPVDGVRDPLGQDYGDAPMTAWENVLFWDNYWRTDGDTSLDFTGEPIAATHDVQLDEAVLDNFNGYLNEHSDTHLWYHGTIDTGGPIDDGSESVAEDAGWYDGGMGPREGTGFHFSRIAGGARPAAGLASSIGGTAARTAIVDHTRDTWPSPVALQVVSPTTAQIGQLLEADFSWHDHQGDSTVEFYFDTDRNPYNGFGQQLGESLPLRTASPTVQHRVVSTSSADLQAGDYYLLARLDDFEQSRYLYADSLVSLAAGPTLSIDNSTVLGNVTGASVGLVTVSDTASAYSLAVADDRFEFSGGVLKLREDESLPGETNDTVVVQVSASRITAPQTTIQQSLDLTVLANQTPWRNMANHLDAQNDGVVAPIDALVIINEIADRDFSDRFSGRLPGTRSESRRFFYDTNGDGFATPIDVLLVVNHIEASSQAEGEAVLVDAPAFDLPHAILEAPHSPSPAERDFYFATAYSEAAFRTVSHGRTHSVVTLRSNRAWRASSAGSLLVPVIRKIPDNGPASDLRISLTDFDESPLASDLTTSAVTPSGRS